MKKFIMGFLTAALLFCALPIYAVTQQAINVSYKNIKILVDGKTVLTDAETFTYNDQVYVPVKFIAEALGKEAKYDKSTGIVAIADIEMPTPKAKLDSTASTKAFLTENYSSLATDIGTTTFSFEIRENKINLISYDYRVMVYCDHNFIYNLKYSIAIDAKTRENVKSQLKSHQEKLANALISAMPDKKFLGGYYDKVVSRSNEIPQKESTVPSSTINLECYFNWTNYEGSILAKYEAANPSTFRWYSIIDSDL